MTTLRDFFPSLRTRQEVYDDILSDPHLRVQFLLWPVEEQERFLDICSGNRGLKVLYDAYFQEIFNPDATPERLISLLSVLLDKEIVAIRSLRSQSSIIEDNQSLMLLDIVVVLNDGSIVNVEMQVSLNKGREWWKNRSLLYLCRCYDNIGSGENYLAIKATTHISIVMQDLFENEEPEFYAKYRLLNVRTHKKYTGNFNLNVLYLKNLNMATENDEKIGLVYWAKAFLAKTWEDLKMIAENNEVFREVGESMFEVNAETIEREMAEAHRKYLETVATYRAEGYNEGYDECKAYMQAELDASRAELNASRAENERLKEELQKYKQ